MRLAFFMVPAAIVANGPAAAESFMTVAEAQASIFPGAHFVPADVTLTEDQVDRLVQELHGTVYHSKVKSWRVSTGGWFFLDQVVGRDDVITYAVGLNDAGAVVGIEILVCNANYDGVRDPKWLAQFKGRKNENAGSLGTDIAVVSGATLSSVHITDGIKRVLATYAQFISPDKPG